MQTAAECAWQWLSSNNFQVSVKNCQLLHTCKNRRQRKRVVEIKLGELCIATVKHMKLLGVVLDNKLNFKKHAGERRSLASSALNVVKIIAGKIRGSRNFLLQLAKSIVGTRLLYGMCLIGRQKQTVLPILSPIYNKAIRIASGAFQTSPTKAVMCEAGELPLEYLTTIIESKTAIRMLEINRIPNLPSVKRISTCFATLTGQIFPKITPLIRVTTQLWKHQPPRVDWSIHDKVRAGENSLIVIAVFYETIEAKYKDHYKIFTDGSKCEGRCGFGVYSDKLSIKGRISDECSVLSAELKAIYTAIKNAPRNKKVVIFSDSASSLRALQTGSSRNSWVQSCDNAIKKKEISFAWIPGHAGIHGNEMADILAKDGRFSRKTDDKLSRQDANRFVMQKVWNAWEEEWVSMNPGHQLNKIKTDVAKWKDNKNQYDQRVLTRIRIGHSHLTHSYLFSALQDPPICKQCTQKLTIEHILIKCTTYNKERKQFKIQGDLVEITQNEVDKEENLLKFVRKIDQ